MYKNLLPIGSVVLLEGGEKRVMIISRVIAQSGSDNIYDYAACYYPEGMIDPDNIFFFNKEAIANVFFVGFQDPEELEFRKQVLDNLGELEVKDGVIIPKGSEIITDNEE